MTENDKKVIEFLDAFFAIFDDDLDDLEEDNNETNK